MTALRAPAPLARVALARDPWRLVAFPALLALLGGLTAVLGLAVVGEALGLGLLAAGGAAVALGAWLAIRVLSLRLVVEVDYLHLTGMGTDRRYHLAPGQLSRLATTGPRRVDLRVRIGSMGRGVGAAKLPAGERVEVIRLGASPSVILVPTERGRVAVGVASETEFVEALMAAARTRAQRPPDAPSTTASAGAFATMVSPALAPAIPAASSRPLTGIERMELEERLVNERRAALAGARTEQAAASFGASVAALTPAGAAMPGAASAAIAPAAAAVTGGVAPTATPPGALSRAIPRAIPRALPRRRPGRPMARQVARPALTLDLLLVSAPLVGAILIWGLAVVTGAPPAAAGMDPLTAVLLLCGPAAALGIWLAHGRWPRLAGLTSAATLITLLLATRALIG